MIGRYERDEMKPSIDTANKLAEFLEVSLDYLTGNTDVLLDTNTLNRILEVQQLPDDVKEKLFYFIDMTVRDYKAKKAYS
ncbi:helix-turn-helix domain-containing protein [Flavobacterium eburneipallidum]|uniref:helix-turn-helix domain-containing protein n=1 Tax=Flavobacterium eburneipallidum TaxID=3003263 RepID=UPI0022ABF5CD|nr:helix-turn-helix transcriptional regulator [Flavobacterium eburneipallidum]